MSIDWPASCGVQGPGEMTMALAVKVCIGHRVVAHHARGRAELREVARHVVDEAVVIVDDEDHAAKASRMRRILVRLSSYSAAGLERAVMPPPPCTRATPLQNCAVRMAMLRSAWPLKPR